MTNLIKELKNIQNKIRELRDADEHKCPYDENQKGNINNPDAICTCSKYDCVIDELNEIELLINKT
tara:strand:+ start:917 stop:1114 length:198 start_codon:yes stop_codon:yes gene_type:complete